MNRKTKSAIPKDVKILCEALAQGYERRKREYENRRLDIIYSHNSGFENSTGGKSSHISDPCAVKTERLERLENSFDAMFIQAVERSLLMLGTDVSRSSQEKLQKAVLLNCENGKDYPYEMLCIDEFSRSEFYRRRKSFINGIGAALGLIE